MSILKIITTINWVLISAYAIGVLWILPQQGSGMGHEMSGMGSVLKAVAVILLLVLIGLNWLPYAWSKIVVFLIEAFVLLLFYYVFSN